MARSFLVSLLFVFGLGLSVAQAQFTVGGVTGGASTAGVNCYGDADGKIAAYGEGWTPQDCGVYAMYCVVAEFPCQPANQNFSCTDPADCTTQTTPSFTAIACGDAQVGNYYTCNAGTATVGNGETISYSFTGAPAWLTINSSTGIMTGTPGAFDHPDISGLLVTATAGTVAANAPTLNIDVNKAPYYASPTCAPAISGTAYTCSLAAIDDDAGDTLSYTMAGAPSWLSIDASTGIVSGTPTGEVDVSGLTVTATDTTSLTANTGAISFVLNQAPAFASFTCVDGTQNTAYSCSTSATDADNDALTYSIAGAPSWVSINSSTGAITGTPSTIGTFSNIVVSASDGISTTATAAFSIVVTNNVTLANTAAASATAGTLTKAELDTLLTNLGVTSGVDLTNALNLDYVEHCIAGLSTTTPTDITGCASGATVGGVAKYALAGSTYSSSFTIDSTLLQNAGLTSSDAALLSDSGSNSCFGSSCQSVLASFLASSSNTLSASSTSAQILAALDDAFEDHYASLANAVTAVTNGNAPTVNSCSVATTNAPSLCSHQPSSHIYCTVHTGNFSINSPTYDTVSYNGNTSAIASTTYKNYVIKYKSRRSDRVLRTETRKLKIIVATADQSTAWQSMQNNSTCSNARSACTNAGGTVGSMTDLANNNSLFASADYVMADKSGTDYSFNKYSCNNAIECHSLGGSNYNRRSCSGSSFANLKVLCNKPVCN